MSILKVVFVIIGTLIGAGFASGQEIYTFFFSYGIKGILGIIISSTIIGLTIYKTFKIIEKNNIKKGQEYKNTKGSKIEQRLFYLSQILSLYNDIKESYPELNEKQISEQLDFNPSTIRRYKREKELLTNLREKDMEK